MQSSFKWNVLANIVGRIWAAVASIICVPIYLSILGPEGYGLAGLFVSFQMIFTFLDFGLSATANREVAKNIALGNPSSANRNMLRTFEYPYWLAGLLIGAIVINCKGWISGVWLNVQHLSHSEVQLSIVIIGISLAARWPISLYSGVLQGLQQQVTQNVITITAISFRTFGAALILIWFEPTVTAFFTVQALVNIVEVLATKYIVWRLLGHSKKSGCFEFALIKRVWHFAVSFNVVSILVMLVGQADRVIISKMLPLEELGFYSVASTPAVSVPFIGLAVVIAAFPRFAAQSVKGDISSNAQHYHLVVQMVAFPAIAAAFAMIFFSYDILFFWTKSADVSLRISSIVSILAVGHLAYSLETPAYNFLIASGLTRLPIVVNAISIVVFIPAMIFTVPYWGLKATAFAWLLQKTIAAVVYNAFISKALLKEQYFSTGMYDLVYYLICSVLWIGGGSFITFGSTGTLGRLIVLILTEIGLVLSVLSISRKVRIFPCQMLGNSKID